MIMFVIETTLYLFFSATLQKAVQAGARAAVVSDPMTAGVPDINARSATGVFGVDCGDASAPCTGFATISCVGGSTCDSTQFDRVFDHMQGFSGLLEQSMVTVTYEYVGLGFAGGPVAPLVTVTVQGVPYRTGIFGLILSNANVLSSLPNQTASMTGEDLAL